MQEFELTELQHTETGDGPWRLHIFGRDGYHSGGVWFRRGPMKYPDEEISADHAKRRADNAVSQKREVRICNGGDMLVFHSQDGKIIYGENFWEEVSAK